MIFRLIEEKDHHDCISLAVSSLGLLEDLNGLPKMKEYLQDRLQGKYYLKLVEIMDIYLCIEDGKIIGMGGIKSLKSNDKIGVIDKLYVSHKIKKKGIGSQLMAVLEKRAKDRGFEKLVLEAFPSAVGFYEKKGFKITGKSEFSPEDISESITLITMEKDL